MGVFIIIIFKMEEKKVCGCNMSTFIKILNMACGVGMVFFGYFNMFAFLSAGANVVLRFGFFFYQM